MSTHARARFQRPLPGNFGLAPPRAESSVEALQRVEAECDWSDAPALLSELLAGGTAAAEGAAAEAPRR